LAGVVAVALEEGDTGAAPVGEGRGGGDLLLRAK